MQALNHVAFGALVGAAVHEPAIALPIALASHFVMDAIPHYGEDPATAPGTNGYHWRTLGDAAASLLFIAGVVALQPANLALILGCIFLATLPDLLWPIALHIKHHGALWDFFKFHKHIQHEDRQFWPVEVIWFMLTTAAVVALLY